MKNKIKLTEAKLNRVIKSALAKVLNEGYGYQKGYLPNIDETEWRLLADKYKKYAQEIDMFIKEFDTFFSTLQQAIQKLGLVLVNEDYDNGNESEGKPYLKIVYCFTDGTDTTNIYDNAEMFDRFSDKLEPLCSELEYAINPDNYEAMSVKVDYGDSVTVTVEFGLWD